MWNFKSSIAWGLLKQTASFTSYRLGVFLGIALSYALLAWLGWFVGVAIARGAMANGASFNTVIALSRTMPTLFILMFCGGLGAGMWFLRKHLYWYVRVPHLALMAEILEGRRLPAGSQIKAGMEIVKERYGDMNRLWALRGQIEKTLPAINPLLPLRALFGMKPEGKGVGINQPYLWLAERPFDEMVLAQGLRKRAVNPYAAAREGLVLLAQNGKPVVGNAVTLQGLGWAYGMIAFVGWLLILALFILLFPGAGLLMVIITGFFAWGTKAGLIDAFTNACLLQIYIGATRGQRPNPDWEARLDADSASFAELGREAETLPGGADRTSAAAQKTVIGGAMPASDEPAAPTEKPSAASAAPAAAVAASAAATPEERAGASAFAPPAELMPSGFVPPKPGAAPQPAPEPAPEPRAAEPARPAAAEPAPPAPAPAPATVAEPPAPAAPPAAAPSPAPAPAAPAAVAAADPEPEPQPDPAPQPEPDPAPIPQPAHPPTPQETPVDPPRETPPPTPPEIPQPEPPQEIPPSTPPELPPETADAELPPLTAEDAVTSTPQALAASPETRSIPASIPDPWSTPEPEEPEDLPPPPAVESAPAAEVVQDPEPAAPPRAEVTQGPQPLADHPEQSATPAEIVDPWSAPSAAASAPPPPPEPEPEPEPEPAPPPEPVVEVAPAPPPLEPAANPAAPPPPQHPAAGAKTVIAPMPFVADDRKPRDEL